MPMHDWTRVKAGVFHDFHLDWISKIKETLNAILPKSYYAMAEQVNGGFGPDILALQLRLPGGGDQPITSPDEANSAVLTRARPRTRIGKETEGEFYQRKQRAVTIRHISGDRLVAVVETVSPGNKSSRSAVDDFVRKAAAFIQNGIHFSFVDPFPPSKRDPGGIHVAIWEEIEGETESSPKNEPLAVVAYECAESIRAYIEPFAVGASVPNMPVFLEFECYIDLPLGTTYDAAWSLVPLRWRRMIDPSIFV